MASKEYNKWYYEQNKERLNEKTKQWYKDNPERRKEYYRKNKDAFMRQSKKWRENHKEHWVKLCCDNRRKKVEKLRAMGCTNAWSVVNGAEPKYKEI